MDNKELVEKLKRVGYHVAEVNGDYYSQGDMVVRLSMPDGAHYGVLVSALEIRATQLDPFEHVVLKMNNLIRKTHIDFYNQKVHAKEEI